MTKHAEPPAADVGARRLIPRGWSAAVFAACGLLGVMLVSTALTAAGSDLRPAGGDISSVLADRARKAGDQENRVARLQAQIDELSEGLDSAVLDAARDDVRAMSPAAGLTEVTGPGLRIELQDAPRSADASGIDPNFLVVHQQDIQAFVNALWAGGAEAITLQGRRIISSTGIKCVGSTVVLDGVPYSPPYVIEAVGNTFDLMTAVDSSPEASTYADYADVYGLGLERTVLDEVVAPPYAGVVTLQHSRAIDD